MQNAECKIATIGGANRKVIPAHFSLEPFFTLAPLKGELAFAMQKTEGSIFLTFTSNLPSTRPALVLLFLALLEREGGIRRMTGGYIFLTFISYLPFTRPALMPRGHFLWLSRAPKEAKCPLGGWTQLVIFRIYL